VKLVPFKSLGAVSYHISYHKHICKAPQVELQSYLPFIVTMAVSSCLWDI